MSGFDVVVITANVLDAVRLGEHAVKDGGTVYLFAGMNACDREATHELGVFPYELVHRIATGVLTWTQGKRILYLGHSGYTAHLAPKAVAMVSANAFRISQMLTGVIRGWENPTIETTTAGVDDWRTSDLTPAIQAVLTGKANLRQHGKIVVLTQ